MCDKGNMSEAAGLGQFVTDTLAAASREIAAVLERTVAGYEEEIQRLQLLLRPRLRVTTAAMKRSRSHRGDQGLLEDLTHPTSRGLLEKTPGRPETSDCQNHMDLRIRVLDDPQTEVLSKQVLKKCPMLKLKFPRGLQEADFLDMLKSTVPQLAGDHKRLEVLTSDRGRRLQRLDLKTLTPEEIHRSISCAGRGTTTVFIRLKAQKEPENMEDEICPLQAKGKDIEDTRPEISSCPQDIDIPPNSSRSRRLKITEQTEEAGYEDQCGSQPAEDAVACPAAQSVEGDHADEKEEEEETVAANDSDDDWKPNESNKELNDEDVKKRTTPLENDQKVHEGAKRHKAFDLKEQLKAQHKTNTNKKTHLCGVCGKSLSDYRSLCRHKMTHSGERPHSCQICGRGFKLVGTLRQHEKIHTHRERSYLCDVCCKMFLTDMALQIHMRTHTNEKPYHCSECGRGFSTKGLLTIHMRIHTGEAPYRCPDCGWSFKRRSNLVNHATVHSGVKAFICTICGKACARKTHLTIHMRTHNGERPYKCTLCDKAFTQSHCLKTHMKSHTATQAAT